MKKKISVLLLTTVIGLGITTSVSAAPVKPDCVFGNPHVCAVLK